MVYIIVWLILSVLIAQLGSNRKIGFSTSLLISLILSPLIGLIFVLLSSNKTDELLKLKLLHDAGSIDQNEYNKQVRKIAPNKQDKKDTLIGFVIVIAIGTILYFLFK